MSAYNAQIWKLRKGEPTEEKPFDSKDFPDIDQAKIWLLDRSNWPVTCEEVYLWIRDENEKIVYSDKIDISERH